MARYWFISKQNRYSAKLALFTFLLAFIVIMLGAYTRLTDAGLSCPDWPNCYGFITAPHTQTQLQDAASKYPLTPVDTKKAWTEMTHRYFAGAEGLLILFLAGSILFRYKSDMKAKVIALSLMTLLCIQVLLGMLTVTAKLKPVIVLSHLLTGLSILSVLWWAYIDLKERSQNFFFHPTRANPIFWIWGAFFVVVMQITLGGWVSTHYAGLACVDFPYCNGVVLPIIQWNHLNTDLISIHMLHRIGAFITGTYILVLSLFLLRNPKYQTQALILLSLILIQITLGILNIVWLRPVWIAMLHQSVAFLLLLTIITSLVQSTNSEHRHGVFT